MKLSGSIAVLMGVLFLAGIPTHMMAQDKSGASGNRGIKSPAPWSVVGPWHYAGPDWKDTINIRADGTFARAMDGKSGKWTLGGSQDHFVLTLAWETMPEDAAVMVGPDEFQAGEKGAVEIRRIRPPLESEAAQPGNGQPKPLPPDKEITLNLLDPDERDRWQIEHGDWKFEENTLTGIEISDIRYLRKIPPPFRLKFDIVVVKGMRPRVYFDRFSFANEGYDVGFSLYPMQRYPKIFPYKLGTKYAVQIDATSDKVEVRIDGKLFDSRSTGVHTLQDLHFSGGDGWSKGTTSFSNITLWYKEPPEKFEEAHPRD